MIFDWGSLDGLSLQHIFGLPLALLTPRHPPGKRGGQLPLPYTFGMEKGRVKTLPYGMKAYFSKAISLWILLW